MKRGVRPSPLSLRKPGPASFDDPSRAPVTAPGIESSVVLGLTAGAWVALRETPLYIGAYGGVSLKLAEGQIR